MFQTSMLKLFQYFSILLFLSGVQLQDLQASQEQTFTQEISLFGQVDPKCYGGIINEEDQIVEEIVGGRDATPNRFPYIVSLQFAHPLDPANKFAHWCGGTLISNNLILTAAHCVFSQNVDFRAAPKLNSGTVNKGELVASLNPQCRHMVGEGRREVVEYYLHEDYQGNAIQGGDIAILKVSPEFQYDGPFINYGGSSQINLQDQRIYTAVGWGATDFSELQLERYLERVVPMKMGFIQYQNTEICEESLEDQYLTITELDPETMLCFQSQGTDTCFGDSGSPVMLADGNYGLNQDGKPEEDVQVAIASWGPDVSCAGNGLPGIYTNVSNYVSWIDDILFKNQDITQKFNEAIFVQSNVSTESEVPPPKFSAKLSFSSFQSAFSKISPVQEEFEDLQDVQTSYIDDIFVADNENQTQFSLDNVLAVDSSYSNQQVQYIYNNDTISSQDNAQSMYQQFYEPNDELVISMKDRNDLRNYEDFNINDTFNNINQTQFSLDNVLAVDSSYINQQVQYVYNNDINESQDSTQIMHQQVYEPFDEILVSMNDTNVVQKYEDFNSNDTFINKNDTQFSLDNVFAVDSSYSNQQVQYIYNNDTITSQDNTQTMHQQIYEANDEGLDSMNDEKNEKLIIFVARNETYKINDKSQENLNYDSYQSISHNQTEYIDQVFSQDMNNQTEYNGYVFYSVDNILQNIQNVGDINDTKQFGNDTEVIEYLPVIVYYQQQTQNSNNQTSDGNFENVLYKNQISQQYIESDENANIDNFTQQSGIVISQILYFDSPETDETTNEKIVVQPVIIKNYTSLEIDDLKKLIENGPIRDSNISIREVLIFEETENDEVDEIAPTQNSKQSLNSQILTTQNVLAESTIIGGQRNSSIQQQDESLENQSPQIDHSKIQISQILYFDSPNPSEQEFFKNDSKIVKESGTIEGIDSEGVDLIGKGVSAPMSETRDLERGQEGVENGEKKNDDEDIEYAWTKKVLSDPEKSPKPLQKIVEPTPTLL